MILDRPVPFAEAIRLLREKQLLPTSLNSVQLQGIEAAIRRYSTFSATVTDAAYLQRISDVVTGIVDPQSRGGAPGSYMDRPTARLALKEFLQSIGYTPEPGKEGTIEDLASDARTDLVVRMNTELAQGFGQHVQANNAVVLDAFPCQELFRLEDRQVARNWPARWRGAGGRFFDNGRMIARKDDPVWTLISRFGNPYPPFDYNSGMWVKPVPRAVAVRLGVITADTTVAASLVAFAPPPALNVAGVSHAMQQAIAAATGAIIENGTLNPGATP